MFNNYLKITFRNLNKQKWYSGFNILGLAVGIACCLLILMYVKHELSYDDFHEKGDRIVRVHMITEDGKLAITPSVAAPTIGQIAPEVESWVRAYNPIGSNPAFITAGDKKFREDNFLYAGSSFFEMFSFKFISGDPSTALDAPQSIVLTKSIAEKIFQSTDVVGESINARIGTSNIDFQVTGVIEDVPSNSQLQFDYLGSLNTLQGWSELSDTELGAANFLTYLLLNDRDAIPNVTETVNQFLATSFPTSFIKGFEFFPFTDIYLESNARFGTSSGSMTNVLVFVFLAFLILLMAIINYVNLVTARSSKRSTEVGIRKVLGGIRSQLINQFYLESTFLTVIAVVTAILLVETFHESFFSLLNVPIDISLFTDSLTWVFLVGITLFTALFAGSYPAFLLSSQKPVRIMRGNSGTSKFGGGIRKGLVIFQFSISTFLILATVIIYQQTNFVLNKELGFDKEEVIVLPARDSELMAKQDLLKQEVLRQPGVLSATYMSNIPGRSFGGYGSIHNQSMDPIGISAGAADANLIQTLSIEIIEGNNFPDNPGYTREQGYVYLVNETLASAHGWTPAEAVGKYFNVLGDREGEIVGVMKDFNYRSLRNEVEPLALFINKDMYNYLLVKLSPNNIRTNISNLEQIWDEIAPHRPFEFDFLDQQMDAMYQAEIQTRNLVLSFSILAVLIACFGLFGLSSYMIESRAKEISIRKVLGASVSRLTTLLSTDFIKLVAIGFALGTPIGWFIMNNWLTNYTYRIDIGITVFMIVAAIALLISLLTVGWQSLKAANNNPIESINRE